MNRVILILAAAAGGCLCGCEDVGAGPDADAAADDSETDFTDALPDSDALDAEQDAEIADIGSDADDADHGGDDADAGDADAAADGEAGPPASACAEMCGFLDACDGVEIPGGTEACGGFCARVHDDVRNCVVSARVDGDCDSAAECLAAPAPGPECDPVCEFAATCEEPGLADGCSEACRTGSADLRTCAQDSVDAVNCARLADCLLSPDVDRTCVAVCDFTSSFCLISADGGEPGCVTSCSAGEPGDVALACMRTAHLLESCDVFAFCSDLFVP